jgi:hypothetical protein
LADAVCQTHNIIRKNLCEERSDEAPEKHAHLNAKIITR